MDAAWGLREPFTMLVSHTERPRELKWYHAGPMLYGDWGTSRFYVLGLAFYFALYSSFWYIVAVGLLVKSGHRMVAMVAFWSALCEHRDVAHSLSSVTATMRKGQ